MSSLGDQIRSDAEIFHNLRPDLQVYRLQSIAGQVDVMQAENENLRKGAKSLLAEVDRLRAQIEMALSRGNHNNSCAFISTGHCVCWKSDLDPSLKKW